MYAKLFILLTNVIYSTYCLPLELEQVYDLKDFISPRIVGGVDAPPEYGKHMAALVVGDFMPLFTCGGSIVTKHHILSAAHCIEPFVVWGQLISSFRAVIGSNKWTSIENNIGFTKHINHPEWSWNTPKNDIGVLFLAEDIELSDNVVIIPLKFDWVDAGAECFVTGWGRTEVMGLAPYKLQLLYVNTISSKQCSDGIKEASVEWSGIPPLDPELEMCTFHSFGHGMCNGDSGSALVLKEHLQQIGIVSWGIPCAVGAPDVFVRISSYKKWLQKILE